VASLRTELNYEQQAHTQTQQREAAANQSCQDAAVQLQMRLQDVQALSGELQQSRSSQHDSDLQVERVQQQLDSATEQRCVTCLPDPRSCVPWSALRLRMLVAQNFQ
jgi:hypothetical protein